ncbi:hypothetical protein CMQ_1658 [Grosmannia clavigera kw1407]|uniref:Uncharacterized protein n=1 Tax=Grosmannia clavigera (strain kw1407 / UAMH 11150) TaxID=655863 RepID=F0XCW5_GROCL|nr:uncharacterized protein CMQ_1658 [Grosmannia clavigera kw1407]EFX04730.1 hypothetical protein CMQ_1658 [Grosmannia clavigera kw1407]
MLSSLRLRTISCPFYGTGCLATEAQNLVVYGGPRSIAHHEAVWAERSGEVLAYNRAKSLYGLNRWE